MAESLRRLAPLVNLHNDCFLNSVIQLLYRTPSFVEELHKAVPTNDTASTLANLFSKMDASGDQFVSPNNLRKILAIHGFPLGTQHDAHEVLMTIIELVRSGTQGSTTVHDVPRDSHDSVLAWADFLRKEGGSFVLSSMYGQTTTSLNCSWCSTGASVLEAFSTVTLNAVPCKETSGPVSVDMMLSYYTSGRMTDQSILCDSCKCSRRKAIRTSFTRLPTHLFFLINHLDETMFLKETVVQLQPTLDMRPYLFESLPKVVGGTEYTLNSVIEYNRTSECGHYTNLSLHNGIWHTFDDMCITRMDSLPEYSTSAYLLAYTKVSSIKRRTRKSK